MSITKTKRTLTLIAVFTFALFSPLTTVQAEMNASTSLFCYPSEDKTFGASGSFALTAGQAPSFTCDIVNASDREVTTMLLGKGAGASTSFATGTNVTLVSNANATTTLSFEPLYQPGEYSFRFSLIDTATKELTTKEMVLMGTLGGEQKPSLGTFSVDKEAYAWQDPFMLTATSTVPAGYDLEKEKVTLRVALLDPLGNECHVFTEGVTVSSSEIKQNFTFPAQGSCANSLAMTLKDKDGTVLDKKMVAVSLPHLVDPETKQGSGIFSSLTWSPVTFLFGTIVLIVVLALVFVARKRGRRSTF